MSKEIRFTSRVLNSGVTGSCNLITIYFPGNISEDKNTIQFIVDCGMFQGEGDDLANFYAFPFDPKELDFAFLTHAHADHYARFLQLVQCGFNSKIFTSLTTKNLLPIGLIDCLRIQEREANAKDCNYSISDYKIEEVDTILKLLTPCFYNMPVSFNDNLKFYLFQNGHVPGAASILVQVSYPGAESMNLFFTGDYNNKNLFFPVPEMPKWIFKLPNVHIFTESTYGAINSPDINEPCFVKNVKEALDEGKSVLIPAFAFGRAQESGYSLVAENFLDDDKYKDIPIYVDGNTTINFSVLFQGTTFAKYPYIKQIYPDRVKYVIRKNKKDSKKNKKKKYYKNADNKNSNQGKKTKGKNRKDHSDRTNQLFEDYNYIKRIPDEQKILRSQVLKDKEQQKIIIASSGSGSYGPSFYYLSECIGDPNFMIHFMGHLFPGSFAYKLYEAKTGEYVTFDLGAYRKEAKLLFTGEFSAHAKLDEILAFLDLFDHVSSVSINHGDQFRAKQTCSKYAHLVTGAPTVIQKADRIIEYSNRKGIVKITDVKEKNKQINDESKSIMQKFEKLTQTI